MANKVSDVAIAIPAYRSAERLSRCLRSIQKLDQDWLSLTVVTDDSGDGQVAQALREEFPTVTWIIHSENLGFARASNDAVFACKNEWVLLLNDDSELVDDPRKPLQNLLADTALFALSLQSVDEHGKVREGAKRLSWRVGIAKILHSKKDQLPLVAGVSETAYAVGGHSLFRRSVFQELGGFDELFHPFYWEDVDLSYRARKVGWRVVFSANAKILHRIDGAIKSTQTRNAIQVATWRNRLLFSHRHAPGIQRLLIPVGILWHKIRAHMLHDHARLQAISEFETQRHSR